MKEYKNDNELNIIGSQLLKEKEYWKSNLSGELVKSYFEYDKINISEMNSTEISEIFKIDKEDAKEILKISNKSDYSLHLVLMSVVILLMEKYTRNKDVIIGTTIANQDEKLNFINNIIPIRAKVNNDETFKDLLLKVKDTTVKGIENQNFPLELMLNEINLGLDKDKCPLFDVMVLLENIQLKGYIKQISPNIVFLFSRSNNEISFKIEYNSNLYIEETINIIGENIRRLLSNLTNNFYAKLSQIEIMKEVEKIELIDKFNNTYVEENDILIHQLFEKKVEETPLNIAVVLGEKRITYLELNDKANQIARRLKEKGVAQNSLVGIMMDNSIEMLIGILAVLKSGGAYLPIDSKNPEERNRMIIQDSGTKIMLAIKNTSNKLEFIEDVIYLDEEKSYYGDKSNLENISNKNDLAYVIYTSGTTGVPKGVMIIHKGLINYANWAVKQYIKDEQINMPLFTSFSFDLTVTSIFVPLISGNTVVIYQADEFEFIVKRIIEDNKVDIIKLTPAHLLMIKELNFENSKIKRIIVGGANLETDLAREIFTKFKKNVEIFNEYGPTETVVGSMCYKYDFIKDKRKYVPIGRAINNTEIYVLDEELKVVDIGIIGELFIGGEGVSKGYLNNELLTSEKFIENPYKKGEIIYRSGDRAKFISENNIEFIGRKDDQINLKGFRIELNEVETHIKNYEEIINAVVLIKTDSVGNKVLCAYLQVKKDIELIDLKSYLAKFIPHYMMPSIFVKVENIPLNLNGKVDKEKLFKIESNMNIKNKYIAPRGSVEKKVEKIWCEVLELDSISINDSFFNIGGDSIKSITILNKINSEFNKNYELVDIYQNETIEDLAEKIKKTNNVTVNDDEEKIRQEIEQFKESFLNGDINYEYDGK